MRWRVEINELTLAQQVEVITWRGSSQGKRNEVKGLVGQ